MTKVSENPLKNQFDKSDSYTIIAVFFTVCYIVSNTLFGTPMTYALIAFLKKK